MSENIPSHLWNLLEYNGKINSDEYCMETVRDKLGGDGWSGYICRITLTNRKNGEKQYIIIKQQKSACEDIISVSNRMYDNEIHFYENIWTKMFNIYQQKTGKLLEFIPHCFGTSQKQLKCLALENITAAAGFETFNKTNCFDDQHFGLLLETYAIFHGLSMVIKHQNRNEYSSMVSPLFRIFRFGFEPDGLFTISMRGIGNIWQSFFDPISEAHIMEKLRFFQSRGNELLYEILDQDIINGVLLHGDCWSNNMMFKYDENGKVQKIKLLDFQQVCSGSPVLDLSYCFYAGGSGESFKKLDYYLKIYHDSLSNTLKEFDLDVENIYPFSRLKEEWKKYCKFGFAMAVMLWRVKFIDDSVPMDVEPNYRKVEVLEPIKIRADKEDEYKQRIRELVFHMYENDFF